MIQVLGIKIIDRIKEAGLTQEILSRHSEHIITRLGFHEITDEVCSREAYIVLHLDGNQADSEKLKSELISLGGIEVREMVFTNDKELLNKEKKENNPDWAISFLNFNSELVYPFESSDFCKIWDLWIEYRKEKKLSHYKKIGEQSALKKLSEMSKGNIEVLKKIIEQSISNNWMGFFELKNDSYGKQQNSKDGVTELMRNIIEGRNQ